MNYTIIRPGILLNEAGTGKVAAAVNIAYGSIPRDDVALVILSSLDEKNTYRRAFDLISGEDSVADALKKI